MAVNGMNFISVDTYPPVLLICTLNWHAQGQHAMLSVRKLSLPLSVALASCFRTQGQIEMPKHQSSVSTRWLARTQFRKRGQIEMPKHQSSVSTRWLLAHDTHLCAFFSFVELEPCQCFWRQHWEILLLIYL